MRLDNPVTVNLLREHPHDAARVLEELAPDAAAELLEALPVNLAAPVLKDMLTRNAADCLAEMSTSAVEELLAEMPEAIVARILRITDPLRVQQLLKKMRVKQRTLVEYQMHFRDGTVGALMDVAILLLPEEISIAHALRRIERGQGDDTGELFVVDEANHLVGMVRVESLLRADRRARIESVMTRGVPSLSVQANIEGLQEHPAWQSYRCLPVTERDHTVVGVLRYPVLTTALIKLEGLMDQTAVAPHLSLVEMCWIVLAELITSVTPMISRRLR
jgi:magnesium transporter